MSVLGSARMTRADWAEAVGSPPECYKTRIQPMLNDLPSNSTRASKDEKEQGWAEERRWLTMMRALSVARTLTFAMLESMCIRIG